MKKKPQRSTKKKEDTTGKTHDWHDYYDFNSFRMVPANTATLERFASDWVNTVKADPSYVIMWKYPIEGRGIAKTTILDWAEKNKDVKNAHTFVKSLCAMRREQGALSREMDGTFVAKTMPMYCEEFKNLEEWRAQLSAKLEAPPTKIVVEMTAFGDPKEKK